MTGVRVGKRVDEGTLVGDTVGLLGRAVNAEGDVGPCEGATLVPQEFSEVSKM